MCDVNQSKQLRHRSLPCSIVLLVWYPCAESFLQNRSMIIQDYLDFSDIVLDRVVPELKKIQNLKCIATFVHDFGGPLPVKLFS